MRSLAYACMFLALPSLVPRSALDAEILRLAEMSADQVRALDRARTVSIMPGGVLEQHGPYLPSYADGYYNQSLAPDPGRRLRPRSFGGASLFT